jgi:nicotinamidase/pyrazinamidase
MKKFPEDTALILVDIQNDFCPGGALAVPEGDQIVGVVNKLIPHFGFVVATQDWHPPGHVSFKERGGPWPPHCVQGTQGAQLHPAINQSAIDLVVRKAASPDQDAYSGFDAQDESGRKLDEVLKSRGIRRVYIAGLATDYCVRATVLDALNSGYEVCAITDAMRAVNVHPDDGAKALDEMKSKGARLLTSDQVLQEVEATTATAR